MSSSATKGAKKKVVDPTQGSKLTSRLGKTRTQDVSEPKESLSKIPDRNFKKKLEDEKTAKKVLDDKRTAAAAASRKLKLNNSSKILPNKATDRTSSSKSIPVQKSSSLQLQSGRKEKNASGFSEKRGKSTIYIPKSTSEKIKSSTKVQPEIDSSRREKKVRASSRERRRSRTLSPSEVKVLRVNPNKAKRKEDKNETEGDLDYEDDFEDYESDFQECSSNDTVSSESLISEKFGSNESVRLEPLQMQTQEERKTVNSASNQRTEEERMLDSGHYELAEARKRAARIETMMMNQKSTVLQEPVNKSYREENNKLQSENKSLPLSMDEGFEDSKSGDFTKSPPLSQIFIIDFRRAKDEKVSKEMSKPLSRGQQLLKMIKLDEVEWSLLEISPVDYDVFIRNYGKLNRQQIHTQTGEDNPECEIQTDEIEMKNKWTQFPITCRNKLNTNEDIKGFQMEQLGVGSEVEEIKTPTWDVLRLNEFMEKAGKVVLSLLEERRHGGSVIQNVTHEFPFSDGCIKLSIDTVTFLSGRPVRLVHYYEVLNKVILTIHSPTDEDIETANIEDYITDCCIGCIWNISEPSMPTKIFYSPSPISACCFHSSNYNVVFAGLEDGSICLWDLKEDEMWHQKIANKSNESYWTLRSATYTTAGDAKKSHLSEIVAIKTLSKIQKESHEKTKNAFVPIQICSLDLDGSFVIWSVLNNMATSVKDIGLSPWGNLRLAKNQQLFLQLGKEIMKDDIKAFFDVEVDSVDTNNLYIATNSTKVLHKTCLGNKSNPPVYKENLLDWCGTTKCIERCPFKQSYFLVGCDDGTVRLHSREMERPLLQLKNDNCTTRINIIQWSKSKPFTIYVLDNDSKIHIWDLSNSDIFPIDTIPTKNWGRIISMELSPCRTESDMSNQYLAIGTDTGSVEIHKLKKHFCYSRRKELVNEMNTFLRYVSIL